MPRTSTNPKNTNIRLSMDPETKARLQAYAAQQRKSVSQLITDWIWAQPVKSDANGNNTGVEEK